MSELKRVMLAEDDADIREIATLALTAMGGLEVEACDNGAELLDRVEAFDPDLIILDVMMPVMTGPDALRALQSSEKFREVPVVFMTAKVMDVDTESYRAQGAAGIIAKPFDVTTLVPTIQEIWQDAAKDQALKAAG